LVAFWAQSLSRDSGVSLYLAEEALVIIEPQMKMASVFHLSKNQMREGERKQIPRSQTKFVTAVDT
jgi:hypothetical protein